MFRFNNIVSDIAYLKKMKGYTLIGLKIQLETYLNFKKKLDVHFYNENTKFNLIGIYINNCYCSVEFFENMFLNKNIINENLECCLSVVNLNKFKFLKVNYKFLFLNSYFEYLNIILNK